MHRLRKQKLALLKIDEKHLTSPQQFKRKFVAKRNIGDWRAFENYDAKPVTIIVEEVIPEEKLPEDIAFVVNDSGLGYWVRFDDVNT